MSILEGIEIKPSLVEIKTLLTLNFRIAIYVKAIATSTIPVPGVGEEIVYHFVRDKKNDREDAPNTGMDMLVNCVLCKSKIGDSLKIFGISRSFTELSVLFQSTRLTGNNTLYFEKYRISVFPYDWYPCFEKDVKDERWEGIENTITNLSSLSKDLENMENIQKHQALQRKEELKRQQQEEERKRLEESNRKREESRKKMEELAKSLMEESMKQRTEDNPDSFAANLAKTLKKK